MNTKKRFLYPLMFIFLYSSTINGQSEWQEEACSCMQTLDLVNRDYEQAQLGVDSCMKIAMLDDFSLFLSEESIDFDNEESIQEEGMRIGQELFMMCEVYRFYIVRLAQNDLEVLEEEHSEEITRGTLRKIKKGDGYQIFLVDTPHGREEFIWLRDFRGSSRFFEGLGEWKNKQVEIGWEQTALFHSRHKHYIYHKEIRWLDIVY